MLGRRYLSTSADIKFTDVPNGLAALSKVPFNGWLQIALFTGIIEVRNLQSPVKEYPGDYDGFGAFGIPGAGSIQDKAKKEKSLAAEVNNGRLAMFAIIGMIVQDGLTGSAWGDWSLYTASPLRAAGPGPDFSTYIGAGAPLGFWDPLGLTKTSGFAQNTPELALTLFRRNRIVEIQHGRVAMLASIGYIVPEYFRFPG